MRQFTLGLLTGLVLTATLAFGGDAMDHFYQQQELNEQRQRNMLLQQQIQIQRQQQQQRNFNELFLNDPC